MLKSNNLDNNLVSKKLVIQMLLAIALMDNKVALLHKRQIMTNELEDPADISIAPTLLQL